jgi:hypothetical protein
MSRHEHNVGWKRAPRRPREYQPADGERLPRAPTREHAAVEASLPESSLRQQPAIEAFARNLRTMRMRGQLSGRELAAKSEGRVDPPYSVIVCLADALEVGVSLLLRQPMLDEAPAALTPRLQPPPPGTKPYEARHAWQAIRDELRVLYAAGVHHRIMAAQLGLTRIQLHSQLHHLFREGMPKR